jgi:hypothetical protein
MFQRRTQGWDNLDVASGNPYAGGDYHKRVFMASIPSLISVLHLSDQHRQSLTHCLFLLPKSEAMELGESILLKIGCF